MVREEHPNRSPAWTGAMSAIAAAMDFIFTRRDGIAAAMWEKKNERKKQGAETRFSAELRF